MHRFLERLLLVHGHWSYHRVSSTMLLFYEKGVLFVTVQLLLAFYSGFSAVSWFENIYYILYNLSMTGFCYMGFGIFEKVFTAQQLLDHPRLYQLVSRPTWRAHVTAFTVPLFRVHLDKKCFLLKVASFQNVHDFVIVSI